LKRPGSDYDSSPFLKAGAENIVDTSFRNVLPLPNPVGMIAFLFEARKGGNEALGGSSVEALLAFTDEKRQGEASRQDTH